MRYDDLPSDAKREPVWVWTSGKDDTKPARSPVGKAPPMSSGLEQQSSVSQVFSSHLSPLKVALAHRWPLFNEAWRKAARMQVAAVPGGV